MTEIDRLIIENLALKDKLQKKEDLIAALIQRLDVAIEKIYILREEIGNIKNAIILDNHSVDYLALINKASLIKEEFSKTERGSPAFQRLRNDLVAISEKLIECDILIYKAKKPG